MRSAKEQIQREMQEEINVKMDEAAHEFYMKRLLDRVMYLDQNKVKSEKHKQFLEVVEHVKAMKAQMCVAKISIQDKQEDFFSAVTIEAPTFAINSEANYKIKENFDYSVTNSDSVNVNCFGDSITMTFTVFDTWVIDEE